MKKPRISRIWVDQRVKDQPLVDNYQRANPDAIVATIDLTPETQAELLHTATARGKREILLTQQQGHTVKECPGTDRQYRCCNYHVINQTSNCPIDCTYCILQFYLNNPVTTVYADTENLLDEVRNKTASQPQRFFRIGTGELSDSLAFEESSKFSTQIVPQFRDIPNALLELKTKSNRVENLVDLDHGGKTVISWSMNPQAIIDAEETKAASLAERLEAIARVQAAGYKLGFHFDPLLYHADWQENYTELIHQMAEVIDPDCITWISIGSLRFPPTMKEEVLKNYPKSKIMFAELIQGMDGKLRYPKPLRLEMYKLVYNALKAWGGEDLFIYFCMESAEIWERVMGFSPESNEHLDFMFAQSLFRRFPDLMESEPDRKAYDEGIPLHQVETAVSGT